MLKDISIDYHNNYLKVYFKGNLIHLFCGRYYFKYLGIDKFVLIEEYASGLSKLVFITQDNVTELNIKRNYSNLFDPSLMKYHELIIHGVYKDFLYSYDDDMIISDVYDNIIFDADTCTFHVEIVIYTSSTPVTAFGTLDIDGFLINESLFIPELDLEIHVNPLKIQQSIEKKIVLIEKVLKRKKKNNLFKEYACYEQELYLKRKKGCQKIK